MLGSVLRVLRVLVGSLTCLDGVSDTPAQDTRNSAPRDRRQLHEFQPDS